MPTTSRPGRRCSSIPASQPARYAASLVEHDALHRTFRGRPLTFLQDPSSTAKLTFGTASSPAQRLVEVEPPEDHELVSLTDDQAEEVAETVPKRQRDVRPVTPVARTASRQPSQSLSVWGLGQPPTSGSGTTRGAPRSLPSRSCSRSELRSRAGEAHATVRGRRAGRPSRASKKHRFGHNRFGKTAARPAGRRWHDLAMARRLLGWALVTPVAAAGILAGHALAYRLAGNTAGPVHSYLEHAPQVVGILATVVLVGLAFQQRSLGRGTPGSCVRRPARVRLPGAPRAARPHRRAAVAPDDARVPRRAPPAGSRRPPVSSRGAPGRRVPERSRRASAAGLRRSVAPAPTARPVREPRIVRFLRATGRGPPLVLAS